MKKSILKLCFIATALQCVSMSANAYNVSISVNAYKMEKVQEDYLTKTRAIERTEWAYRCGHLNNFIIELEDEDQETNDELYAWALYRLNGKQRLRPRYPVFSSKDVRQTWIAPTDRNASCDIPEGFGVVVYGRS